MIRYIYLVLITMLIVVAVAGCEKEVDVEQQNVQTFLGKNMVGFYENGGDILVISNTIQAFISADGLIFNLAEARLTACIKCTFSAVPSMGADIGVEVNVGGILIKEEIYEVIKESDDRLWLWHAESVRGLVIYK